MNKKNKFKIGIIMAVIFVVLFVACLFFLIQSTSQHFLESSKVMSSQIESLIESNENEKNELQESLKEEYISKATALAYILQNDESIEKDYDELCKVAELLNIDEVNVFGKDGLIARQHPGSQQ